MYGSYCAAILGRSVAATTAIMKGLIHVLIAEFTNFKSKGDRQ